MYVPDIEWHQTDSLDEASRLMRRLAPDAKLLAGGTDLLVDLKAGRVSTRHLVSLSGVDALKGISRDGAGLRIGALATIASLIESPLVADGFGPLLDAATQMAAPQVRNAATVGGNIASAVPCADLPPILIAMNATLLLWSPEGQRPVALCDFFVGPRRTVLKDNEILSAILVPALPPGFGAAYERFSMRDGNSIAVAAVAASLRIDDQGAIKDARIVLGAVAPVPRLAESAGRCLIGQGPGDGAFAEAAREAMAVADPISDVRGSAQYRRDLVGVLTTRALRTASRRSKEATG